MSLAFAGLFSVAGGGFEFFQIFAFVGGHRVEAGRAQRRVQVVQGAAIFAVKIFGGILERTDRAVGTDRDRAEWAGDNLDAAERRGDGDFTGGAVGIVDQHHLGGFTGLDRARGAADTDGGDRGIEHHGVGIGLGELPRHERHHAGHQRNAQIAGLLVRVINHFVDHGAGIGVQREDGVVGEDHTDRGIGTGFDDIALEDVVALLRGYFGAVNAGDLDNAFDGLVSSSSVIFVSS